jgi:hypothetical protein
MSTATWGAAKRRVVIYGCATIAAIALWVVFAWIYGSMLNSPGLPIGKGRLDLWMQFLSGGWASDLVERIENEEPILYSRGNLAYLISAGFIIQGLIPTLAAVGILAELIDLRWRTAMKASGVILEQQDMMARSFREVMIKLFPESEQKERRPEMDWLSQDTAYEVAERWCKQSAPYEMGQEAADRALAEIKERRANFRERQPMPERLHTIVAY